MAWLPHKAQASTVAAEHDHGPRLGFPAQPPVSTAHLVLDAGQHVGALQLLHLGHGFDHGIRALGSPLGLLDRDGGCDSVPCCLPGLPLGMGLRAIVYDGWAC